MEDKSRSLNLLELIEQYGKTNRLIGVNEATPAQAREYDFDEAREYLEIERDFLMGKIKESLK